MNIENKDLNEGSDLNLHLIFSYFLRYWKLFAASTIICLLFAVVYLKTSTKIYQVTAKVLLKDAQKGTFNSQTDVLADFGFQATNSNVENEIEVLNSKSVVQMAVLRSGVYTKYFRSRMFKSSPIYKDVSPVQLTILQEDLNNLSAVLDVKLTLNKDSLYEVSYKYENLNEGLEIESEAQTINSYPYVLETVKGDIMLTQNDKAEKISQIQIKVYPLQAVTLAYKNAVAISPISKTASVAIIAINDAVPMNASNFINSMIVCYNEQSNEDKNILARKTEDFINERIEVIGKDLRGQEENLASYKRSKQLINPTIDAPQVVQNRSQYLTKLEEVKLQLEQSAHLLNYIKEPRNDMQAIPSMLGLANEATLSALVTRYNLEVAKRNQLLSTATEENPVLATVTDAVKRTRMDIIESVEALNVSLQLRKKSLEELTNKYTNRAAETPAIERTFTDLTRERDIKSQLYVMLLQKYEENALTLAVTADNLKCIDPASISPNPVAPRSTMIMAIALLMGLAIPSAGIYVRELLRVKLENVEELEALSNLPIVGSVPLKNGIIEKNDAIVVAENRNDIMTEAFRSIRTNLHFVMKKHEKKCDVIMFTSTTSGEGKTFISSNFAVSQAVLGKRVLLVGLDIRRPRLAEVFNISRHQKGITSYLAGNEENTEILNKYIVPSGVLDNLYLLPAGIVPPNPAELLARKNLDTAIEYLQQKFDCIVLDTAPIGLVTDSIIMSRVADVVVYVTRANYTEKSALQFLKSLTEQGKLKNACVVFNAEDLRRISSKKRINSKYQYGYSYYGAGYGIEESEKK